MRWKCAARERLGRHEREREEHRAAAQHEQERAALLQPERGRRFGGVGGEPRGGRGCELRECQQRRDDQAGDERRPPDEPMPAQQPQRAEDAADDTVQQACRHARRTGDQVVGAAQLLEAAAERLGNEHEGRDGDELVARDREPQANARLAELLRPLVDERVVDPAARQRALRLVEQRVAREVDAPVGACARLGERARFRRCECFGRFVADVVLRQPAHETVGRAVGPEANDRFLDRAGREHAHRPPVRRIDVATRQFRERGAPAAFELDVVLRRSVMVEARGAAGVGRCELVAHSQRLSGGDRLHSIHAHIEIDQRNRTREQVDGDGQRRCRQQRVRDPEHRLASESFHAKGFYGTGLWGRLQQAATSRVRPKADLQASPEILRTRWRAYCVSYKSAAGTAALRWHDDRTGERRCSTNGQRSRSCPSIRWQRSMPRACSRAGCPRAIRDRRRRGCARCWPTSVTGGVSIRIGCRRCACSTARACGCWRRCSPSTRRRGRARSRMSGGSRGRRSSSAQRSRRLSSTCSSSCATRSSTKGCSRACPTSWCDCSGIAKSRWRSRCSSTTRGSARAGNRCTICTASHATMASPRRRSSSASATAAVK